MFTSQNECLKLDLGKISSADFWSTSLSFNNQASKQQVLIVMTNDKLLCSSPLPRNTLGITHYDRWQSELTDKVNSEPQQSLIFWYSQSSGLCLSWGRGKEYSNIFSKYSYYFGHYQLSSFLKWYILETGSVSVTECKGGKLPTLVIFIATHHHKK